MTNTGIPLEIPPCAGMTTKAALSNQSLQST